MNDFNGLIDQFYETVEDPSRWSFALHSLSDVIGGCSFLMGIHPTRADQKLITGTRIDSDVLDLIEQRYSSPETSPVVALMPRVPVAKVVPRRAVYPDAEYFRSEPYEEVFRPLKLMHVAIACMLRGPDCMGSLGILRERWSARPDHHDFQLLKQFLPHMGRSIRLYLRFSLLEVHRSAMERAVDHLPCGVFLVDNSARVLYQNHTAECMVTNPVGVKVIKGTLQAASVGETQELQRLIAAVTVNTRAPDSAGSGMVLHRPWPHRPLWATVLPIPEQMNTASFGFPMVHPAALVMVCDPETMAELPVDNLRRLYGLTPAEARLAQALCNGKSLNAFSEEANHTIETVRWRLKQILAKTGTHRQSELVRLLLASVVDLGAARG